MGLHSRVQNLAAMFETKAMSNAVEKAFSDCGNCNQRVKCSSQIIPIRKLYRAVADPSVMPCEPSPPSLAAARLFVTQCATCDKLGICLELWADRNNCKDLVPAVRRTLDGMRGMDEREAASHIEGWLREVKLSGPEVLRKAALVWLKCERDKKYENPIMVCRGHYLNKK